MPQTLRYLFFLLAVLFVPLASAKDMPVVNPAEIVGKHGKPDRMEFTEYDKPRPPLVTRMYEYTKPSVRITLLANAPWGSPPPYSSWLLMGYQDLKSNAVISQDEAKQRFASRGKK